MYINDHVVHSYMYFNRTYISRGNDDLVQSRALAASSILFFAVLILLLSR